MFLVHIFKYYNEIIKISSLHIFVLEFKGSGYCEFYKDDRVIESHFFQEER